MRVVNRPPLRFVCEHCKAENEGDEDEFTDLGTIPPLFGATCAFCHARVAVFISALTAKVVGTESPFHDHPKPGVVHIHVTQLPPTISGGGKEPPR